MIHKLIFIIILVISISLSFLSMRTMTATFDETAHIPAGYVYWHDRDFRLNPQHPPFVKLLATLPLLFTHIQTDHAELLKSNPNQWTFGKYFLYGEGNNTDNILLWSRLPIIGLFALLLVYVFLFGRYLFDTTTGLIALALVGFSTTVLAHSHVVTTDLAVTTFILIFFYYFWRLLPEFFIKKPQRKSPIIKSPVVTRNLVLAGIAAGLALASKYSGLLILPIAGLILVYYWLRHSLSLRSMVTIYLFLLLASVIIIWASYLLSVNPVAYLHGLGTVNADHPASYYAYFWGQAKQGTWWYYFLGAYLIKTPIPYLILLVLAFFWLWHDRLFYQEKYLFLILPVIVFILVTSLFAAPIGVRYLLPIYPFLALIIASCYRYFLHNTYGKIFGIILIVWYIVPVVTSYPNYFAYTNEFFGGPSQAYRYLDDSNIDWGGGLRWLASYLQEHHFERINLVYNGNGDPVYYGIRVNQNLKISDWLLHTPESGTYYIIGATALARGMAANSANHLQSDWFTKYQPIADINHAFYIYKF